MNQSENEWRARSLAAGLDPHEVKSVSRRYDMYREYTEAHGGNTLPLARWYKWYRVEKLSEGHAMLSPPAAGCSVGESVAQPGGVISEPDFLELLELYRASCRDA
jgi:hypothetical protein